MQGFCNFCCIYMCTPIVRFYVAHHMYVAANYNIPGVYICAAIVLFVAPPGVPQ